MTRMRPNSRALAPMVLGPFAPEVLSYDLVRSVPRDSRFNISPGLNVAVQHVRRTGPAQWKPLVTLGGSTNLPIAFRQVAVIRGDSVGP